MPQIIAPTWPPDPADHHHLSSSPKSDWAWEFLRRDTGYQRAATASRFEMLKVATIGAGVPVFKLFKREEAAQDWALCSFR